MSSNHSVPGTVHYVVHEPGGAPSPLVFELRGPLTAAGAERIAARIVERHRALHVSLESHTGAHRTLTITSSGAAGHPAQLSPQLLADLLAVPPGAETVPLSGAQRGLAREAAARQEDRSRHVEQLAWTWTGPLDTSRFAAAWQSVADRECVLRASLDWVADPRMVLHERVAVNVVRHSRAALPWTDLVERDRAQGFELYRAGLMRLTLLDGPPAGTGGGAQPTTRVLLTYHRALLDERAVHLLLREFYRAYLAGGALPGGERRPDVRDHARWLARQGTEAARTFWTRAAPPAGAAVSPGRAAGPTGQRGSAQVQRRLRSAQSLRLRAWAAGWGAGESSALHVAWALLLHRAAGVPGPTRVSFGVSVPGRDIALPGAADVPGLLGGPLPLTVTVDPQGSLGALVRQVRDAVLDMTAYPWVSEELIRQWSGRGDGGVLSDTALVFDSRPELPAAVRSELATQGIRVDVPHLVRGDTSLALTLVARHAPDGGLGLTALYDRAVLKDADATQALSQCVHLLCALAEFPDPHTSVGQVLRVLQGAAVPSAAPSAQPGQDALATLRAGQPDADVICLVADAGVVPGAYDLFARHHDGPETIVVLRCPTPPRALPAGLDEALGRGRRLLLCGCGPGALTAYRIAWTAAAGQDVVVIMTSIGSAADSASALSQGLRAVPARST
ncbi:condensation domain-containing protein [Streptomyces canus]|uniref:condensation domain-containing protein n=1 Tax=Streptomyces canus TaxID=58343 RepID=UPI002E3537A7|nr:condensation domain-containing protein [Streptomyces canus]